MFLMKRFTFLPLLLLCMTLASCGGGSSSEALYTVGGNASGLSGGNVVTLQNNGGDSISVASSGAFAFATPMAYGTTYSVTVSAQPAGVTCAVQQATGTVPSANVESIAVVCNAKIAVTISGLAASLDTPAGLTGTGLVVQNNGIDASPVPVDSTIEFEVLGGSPYAVTVQSQPVGQTCVASNASGTTASTTVAVSVVCSPISDSGGSHMYIPQPDGLTSYSLDPLNGQPASITSVVAGSDHLVFAAEGKYAYATSQDRILAFSANANNGALTPLFNQSFAWSSAQRARVDTRGSHLYFTAVSFFNVYLIGYSIDTATGALTQTDQVQVFTLGDVAVDPRGRFVYALASTGGIHAFAVDQATGKLVETPHVTSLPAGLGPTDSDINFVFSPNGEFVYVNTLSGVAAFSIDAVTGALSQVAGSPFSGSDGYGPVAIDSTGSFLYTTNASLPGTIVGHGIDVGSGALSNLDGSPFLLGARRALKLAFGPNGKNFYATTSSDGSLNADGVLIAAHNAASGILAVVPGIVADFQTGLATNPLNNALRFDPAGKFAYSLGHIPIGSAGALSVMSIDPATGALDSHLITPFGSPGGGAATFEVR